MKFFISRLLLIMLVVAPITLSLFSYCPVLYREPPRVEEARGYKSWTSVNDLPYPASETASDNCRLDSTDTRSPHADYSLRVYVNSLGRDAMFSATPRFPEGSTIVAEHLPRPESPQPALLVIMVKRPQGSIPAAGDWEYMEGDPTGGRVLSTQRRRCAQCHACAAASDGVFRSYLPSGGR